MKTLKTHCCWSRSLLSGDYSVSGNINIYSVYSACIANDFTYLMAEQTASVSICTFVKKILFPSKFGSIFVLKVESQTGSIPGRWHKVFRKQSF